MKKFILLLGLLFGTTAARADEGMWLLKLMEEQHLADSLRKAGLLLSPQELYSEDAPSLRECIGIFGGGCTGEIISPNGLVLTNNHCGFGFVHAMSTMEHNYLQDGFFAKSRSEELPVPELSFTFTLGFQEVTEEVNALARKKKMSTFELRDNNYFDLATSLAAKSRFKDKPGLSHRIVQFFRGNRFFIVYLQEFTDVRMVANPPQNFAQFGENQDNWMWPRHNPDFAVFRIYADADGNPAAYSESNVPLSTKKFLPISLDGFREGDYAMIMGYPGRTNRYLTASEIRLRTQSINHPINLVGEAQLAYMKGVMDSDPRLDLEMASDFFGLGNVVKNFGGMNEAVRKTRLISRRETDEKAFRAWAEKSGRKEYRDIIERIDALCAQYGDVIFDRNLYGSTISQTDNFLSFYELNKLKSEIEHYETLRAAAASDSAKVAAARQGVSAHLSGIARRFTTDRLAVSKGLLGVTLPYWFREKKTDKSPAFLPSSAAIDGWLDRLFSESLFRDSAAIAAFAENPSVAVLENDLYYQSLAEADRFEKEQFSAAMTAYDKERQELDKIYTRALCEMQNWTKAPDANFTLRMTYGHVRGMKPRDGVTYDYRTVVDGMFEKENPADSDYRVNERVRELVNARNFGRYAREDGKLPACFISDNDITGGNSGSPVLNARGELIGCAFDGNIESLSSDLQYNPSLQRCINADIRYILWVLDIYGGSRYLFDEMDIRGGR